MRKKYQEEGYVGLLILLFSVAIIGLLFVAMYLTPEVSDEGRIGATDFEKAQDTIQAGKEAGEVLDAQREILKSLE